MEGGRKGNEEAGAVLALVVLGLGGLGYGWWWLGDAVRGRWLRRIGREAGYGRAPSDAVEQLAWLLTNRLEDLQGLFVLFLVVSAAGLMEGNARRRAVALSGFGLRRLRAGRALLLVWLGMVGSSVAAPVALPYGWVAGGLGAMLLVVMYTVGRGLRRVH